MKLVVFGLTITSSWGNGHATTYRSLLSALARRGHRIEFIEKDQNWYRNNRDLPIPTFCSVHLYDKWEDENAVLIQICSDADAVLIGSYFPDAIAVTRALFEKDECPVFFYDIDTPVTVRRLHVEGGTEYLDPSLIPGYAAILSFTGGPMLRELEKVFGAKRAISLYCSVDDALYRPVQSCAQYRCDLGYLGTYARDRQPKLMRLFNDTAALLPTRKFLLAGSQYPGDVPWRPNVRHVLHIPPPDHAVFYSSSRFSLNLTRQAMVAAGYSPSVRLFEASACGATIISDAWPGIEEFLTPGEEILLAGGTAEIADILENMSETERKQIGQRARERILSAHTATHRAVEFEQIITACISSQTVQR